MGNINQFKAAEMLLVSEISGTHGGEYEDDSLLGHSAV
jgi:hypothetical protein